jgi:HlyD family secretion protein
MTRWLKWVIFAAVGVAVVAAIAFAVRSPAVAVETGRVTRGDLKVTIEEEGKTRVRNRFVVSTPAAGLVYRVTLKEGDPVSVGAVVARVEPLPLDERSREQARARLRSAEAAERASTARVRQAKEALAQSQRDHRRADELAQRGLRSPQEREQAELAEATRARDLEAARFAATAAAFEAEAERAALLEPGQRASSGTPGIGIRSPVAGRVLRVVQESERSLPAGSPVVEVGDPAELEIVVDLLSSDAVRVSPGAPLEVEGGDGRRLRGHVRTIEPSAFTKVSALGVEEQRVNVVGDLDEAPGPLGDGYRVDARITLWDGKAVLKAPVSALFRSGVRWEAFVVEGNRARLREVEVGRRSETEAEITRGLQLGDTVILHPTDRISGGVRVRTLSPGAR